MKIVLLPIMLAIGACATISQTNPDNIVLLSGSIQSIKYERDIIPQNGDVVVGSWNRVKLDDVKALVGHFGSRAAEVELTMSAMPTQKAYLDKEVYVLLKSRPNGSFQTLMWAYADSGLCIPSDAAQALFIEEELSHLRRAGKVNWKADCN
jgi:hypothetical protein